VHLSIWVLTLLAPPCVANWVWQGTKNLTMGKSHSLQTPAVRRYGLWAVPAITDATMLAGAFFEHKI
jgi:hypothetical protein